MKLLTQLDECCTEYLSCPIKQDAAHLLLLLHATHIAPNEIANILAHRVFSQTLSIDEKRGRMRFIADYCAHPERPVTHHSRYVVTHYTEQERLTIIQKSLTRLNDLILIEEPGIETQAAILWQVFRLGQIQWHEQQGFERALAIRELRHLDCWPSLSHALHSLRNIRDCIRHPQDRLDIIPSDNIEFVAALFQKINPSVQRIFTRGIVADFTSYKSEIDSLRRPTLATHNSFAALANEELKERAEQQLAPKTESLEAQARQLAEKVKQLERTYQKIAALFDSIPQSTVIELTILHKGKEKVSRKIPLVVKTDKLIINFSLYSEEASLQGKQQYLKQHTQQINAFRKSVIATQFMQLIMMGSPDAVTFSCQHVDIIAHSPPFIHARIIAAEGMTPERFTSAKLFFLELLMSHIPHSSVPVMILNQLLKHLGKGKFEKEINLLDLISLLTHRITMAVFSTEEKEHISATIRALYELAGNKKIKLANSDRWLAPIVKYTESLGADDVPDPTLVELMLGDSAQLSDNWKINKFQYLNTLNALTITCKNLALYRLIFEKLLTNTARLAQKTKTPPPNALLHLACKVYTVDEVETKTPPPFVLAELLASGCFNVNARDTEHNTPLMTVCLHLATTDESVIQQQVEKIQLLLAQEDIDFLRTKSYSPGKHTATRKVNAFYFCYKNACWDAVALFIQKSLEENSIHDLLAPCFIRGSELILPNKIGAQDAKAKLIHDLIKYCYTLQEALLSKDNSFNSFNDLIAFDPDTIKETMRERLSLRQDVHGLVKKVKDYNMLLIKLRKINEVLQKLGSKHSLQFVDKAPKPKPTTVRLSTHNDTVFTSNGKRPAIHNTVTQAPEQVIAT